MDTSLIIDIAVVSFCAFLFLLYHMYEIPPPLVRISSLFDREANTTKQTFSLCNFYIDVQLSVGDSVMVFTGIHNTEIQHRSPAKLHP